MKIHQVSAAVFLFIASALAQPALAENKNSGTGNEPTPKTTMGLAVTQKAETFSEVVSSETTVTGFILPVNKDLPDQEKPRKAKKGQTEDEPKKGKQEVKEVATAKRQEKPEKVSGNGESGNDLLNARSSAGRPQSAARPGRGAAGSAVKVAGNAAKAAKAVKPVKVGGVGVGRIKVGKN